LDGKAAFHGGFSVGDAPACRLRSGGLRQRQREPAIAIAFEDFEKVDIRVGTVVQAEPFPAARRPAFRLWVDFGAALGVRKSSAQLTVHYTPDALIGRQVAAVVNFPPRRIGTFMSEVLVLGFPDAAGAVVLLNVDQPVPDGGRLF